MNLFEFLVTNYQGLSRKLHHQFFPRKHHKVSTSSLFKVRQGNFVYLWEYLSCLSKVTIMTVNPNQDMFVEAFHNYLKIRQFSEPLTQKPSNSMEEIMSRMECYMKGEEEKHREKIQRCEGEKHHWIKLLQ